MATAPAQGQLTFYPAYCYSASPTYFAWVKVTASDIHHVLRPRHGFSDITPYNQQLGPGLLLFYSNHPVQFVQVVGVIVAVEDYWEKAWLFTVDDSSGATIDVICRKPAQVAVQSGEEVKKEKDKEEEKKKTKQQQKQQKQQNVEDDIKENDPRVEIVRHLECGVVVQVKGTIGTFRRERQIQLERIVVVKDTTAEMRLIQARTKMLADILSKPWVVSATTQKRLHQEARGEVELDRNRSKKAMERRARRLAREKNDAEQIAREYEKEDEQRALLAEEARLAGKLLCNER